MRPKFVPVLLFFLSACSTVNNSKGTLNTTEKDYECEERKGVALCRVMDDKPSLDFFIYDENNNEVLYKKTLPKGGKVTWVDDRRIEIISFGAMPSIEDQSQEKYYFLVDEKKVVFQNKSNLNN